MIQNLFIGLNVIIDKYNALSIKLGLSLGLAERFTWTDALSMGIDEIEEKTTEYQHQFKSFTQSMKDAAKEAGDWISKYLFPKTEKGFVSNNDPGEGNLSGDDYPVDPKGPFRPSFHYR